MYTGEGIMGEDGVSFDGEVYALSREDGSVRVSYDSANTWELIAKEEPRMFRYETGAIIMSAEQIIQPRMWKISDDAWFVTYANYNNLNYAYDRLSRPVYGKVFFPEAGWYATQAKLIYDAADVQDMADPATVLTAEGRLLTIYYNTGDKTYYAKWLADNPDAAEEEAGRESDITDSGVPNESETPEVTGTITHSGRSLALDGTVLINQYVTIDGFEGIDLEANGGLLIFKDEVTEETATEENADYDQAVLQRETRLLRWALGCIC